MKLRPINELNENDVIELTPQWMATEYDRLNASLFDGKLMECQFGLFTTGKGSQGGTLGWFKMTGRNLWVSKQSRRIYTRGGLGDSEKIWINKENFVEYCKPKIELNGNYRWTKKAALSTLVHEMCHYYCNMNGWRPAQHHGPDFMSIAFHVSQKSNEFFTVERVARAEQMSEVELNSEFAEKKKKREEAKKAKVIMTFIFMANGTVRLVNALNNEVVNNIVRLEFTGSRCKKIVVSRDPALMDVVFSRGYKGTMRAYRFWEVQNEDFVKELDNYDTQVKWENEMPAGASVNEAVWDNRPNFVKNGDKVDTRGAYNVVHGVLLSASPDFQESMRAFKNTETYNRETGAYLKVIDIYKKYGGQYYNYIVKAIVKLPKGHGGDIKREIADVIDEELSKCGFVQVRTKDVYGPVKLQPMV